MAFAKSADGPTPGSSADDVPDADPYDVARTVCLQQLASSPKTRGQLATVLRRRGVDDAVASSVLDRLTEVQLVDDSAIAEHYVRTRHASSGKAGRALGQELRARGVDDATVSEALGTIDPEQELATAHALVAKKIRSTRGLELEVRTRRLVGMLARKGYSGGLALRVVREALAAERELDSLEAAFLDGLDVDLSDAARLGE